MINTISLSDFRTAWANSSRSESFSYEGLEVLYNFLEEVDPDFDLDIVALDCDFVEASILDVAKDYSILDDVEIETSKDIIDGEIVITIDDMNQVLLDIKEDLNSKTMVLTVDDNTIIYQNF